MTKFCFSGFYDDYGALHGVYLGRQSNLHVEHMHHLQPTKVRVVRGPDPTAGTPATGICARYSGIRMETVVTTCLSSRTVLMQDPLTQNSERGSRTDWQTLRLLGDVHYATGHRDTPEHHPGYHASS